MVILKTWKPGQANVQQATVFTFQSNEHLPWVFG